MTELFRIVYTEPALEDLEEKARYIAETLQAPDTAEAWYLRLRTEIQKDLVFFPCKHALYPDGKWQAKGVRQAVFRNDVILYSVDEAEHIIYIRAVCTKGQDISTHLKEFK